MAGKHEHDHVHCQHARIAYCARCAVVHCKDCGREWKDNPPQTWYPWWQGSGTYTPGIVYCGSTTTGTIGAGAITGNTCTDGTAITYTTNDHSACGGH
jgi:hypothetical protein